MRVYHFINSKYGLENIRRKRLKISMLHDLNDPFELLALELSDRKIRNTFLNIKDKLHTNRGVLCFSENWSNPVMWSHYAEKHHGLCLEFEVSQDLLAKVEYSSSRLSGELNDLLSGNATRKELAMTRILSTKFSHWKYEAEWRIFAGFDTPDVRGNYFIDFSDQLKLVGVIVGPRSKVSRDELRRAFKFAKLNPAPTAFKSRLAFKSFRVVKQRAESLWT
jgi:Protein of unknown function (DUF2971)